MTWPSATPFLQNLSQPLPMDALPARLLGLPYLYLAHQDAIAVSLGVGMIVYLIFKRFEPVLVYQHFWLLVVPPSLVAAFILSAHYDPARAAALAFGLHYATILTVTLVYRAGPWHPLAQYPGPFVFRLSKLALAWVTSDGRQFEHLKRLHDTYGDIVRVGPNEVSIRDPSAIIPVLGPNGLPKGPRAYHVRFDAPIGQSSLEDWVYEHMTHT